MGLAACLRRLPISRFSILLQVAAVGLYRIPCCYALFSLYGRCTTHSRCISHAVCRFLSTREPRSLSVSSHTIYTYSLPICSFTSAAFLHVFIPLRFSRAFWHSGGRRKGARLHLSLLQQALYIPATSPILRRELARGSGLDSVFAHLEFFCLKLQHPTGALLCRLSFSDYIWAVGACIYRPPAYILLDIHHPPSLATFHEALASSPLSWCLELVSDPRYVYP